MSFVETFNALPVAELHRYAQTATVADAVAAEQGRSFENFAALISPAADLEQLARQAHALTVRHFGRVMRLYAPLYLSNECINVCRYCGFSRDNPILRVTLTVEQAEVEARYLQNEGFRHILLVAGEHPHFVSKTFLRDCVAKLRPTWPSIALEVGPLETEEYRPIVEAGAEGLTIYQETYDREVYASMHASGPKTNFNSRLETPERAYLAGFRRLGIGALLGLTDWRYEAICVAAHIQYLLKHCWQAQITMSVPRLRPAVGAFQPLSQVSDRELVQFICAIRMTFPEIGIALSTRESAKLRDGLVPLGLTMISAGSHTEPGGYTGQGHGDLHLTKGGHRIDAQGEHATVQFEIADNRSPSQVAAKLNTLGYEPVWKDWDMALNG